MKTRGNGVLNSALDEDKKLASRVDRFTPRKCSSISSRSKPSKTTRGTVQLPIY